LTAAVAVEGDAAIVGARAEKRSGKKSATVFTAWRQMLYGMVEGWEEHRAGIEEKWNFGTVAAGPDGGPAAYALAADGQKLELGGLLRHLTEVVCASLLDPGPQVEPGEEARFDAVAVAVPEFLSAAQRAPVLDAVRASVHARLGAHVAVSAVNEPLCAALQLCLIPPVVPRRFLLVDWGASKLSAAVFALTQVAAARKLSLSLSLSLSLPFSHTHTQPLRTALLHQRGRRAVMPRGARARGRAGGAALGGAERVGGGRSRPGSSRWRRWPLAPTFLSRARKSSGRSAHLMDRTPFGGVGEVRTCRALPCEETSRIVQDSDTKWREAEELRGRARYRSLIAQREVGR